MSRRVVVTGIGCVTPVGLDPLTAWKAVTEGRSGIGPITRFDASKFPTTFAAELKNFNIEDFCTPEVAESVRFTSLHIPYGVAAAIQAFADCGLDVSTLEDPTRFGVYLGAGEGNQDFDLCLTAIANSTQKTGEFDGEHFIQNYLPTMNPRRECFLEPSVLSARVAGLVGAQGPVSNTLTACAASTQAIAEGTDTIRTGVADVMLVGGAHSMIHQHGVTGFSLLTALSRRNDNPSAASRPFDRERDGFVMGEGAAMLVLEEYEHAKARGAKIYGEVKGFGISCDAYRITDIPPDGNGMARAIQDALANAQMNPEQISYVNAHGTSTGANDRTETLALKTGFGNHAYKVPISSTKSMTGHLVGACGALETIFSLFALHTQTIPPTINYEFPDPDCDLDYTPNVAREISVTGVMTNNSGFGGQNVSLILTKV